MDFSKWLGRNSASPVIPIVLRAMVPLSAIATLATQQHTTSTTPAIQLAPLTTRTSPLLVDSVSVVPLTV